MADDKSSGGGEAVLNLPLEDHGSDGEDGAEGQSLGEQNSDSVHHQQEEVQFGFFCPREKRKLNHLNELKMILILVIKLQDLKLPAFSAKAAWGRSSVLTIGARWRLSPSRLFARSRGCPATMRRCGRRYC